MPTTRIFEIERDQETLILTLKENLGEINYSESNASDAFEAFNDPSIKNVVMDFHRSDYFGSTSLGLFFKLWKQVTLRKGRMAFCNLSEHEREILKSTRLDNCWKLCGTREEAMQYVIQESALS